jgi:L-malate glycosyltransferase
MRISGSGRSAPRIGIRNKMVVYTSERSRRLPDKILFLSNYGSVRGGGEISLMLLLRELDRARYQPVLAIPESGDLESEAERLGIPCRVVEIPKIKSLTGPFRMHPAARKLAKLIESENISLVHCNTPARGSLISALAARRAGVPSVWHVRIQDSEGFADKLLFRMHSKIITNSRAVARKFSRFDGFEEKVAPIHNPVDLDAFKPARPDSDLRNALGAGPRDVLVGVAGRLVAFKGHKYFIEAAEILSRVRAGWANYLRFVIVGDGPDMDKLKERVKESDARSRIVFAGHRTDMPAVMNAFDIFVLPSDSEHFGRVIIEAMACGKPVVATDAGGVPEIVEGGVTGILVPPKDSIQLSVAIGKIAKYEETAHAFGASGRVRAVKLFSSTKHAESVQEIYENLLRGH